MDIDSILCDYLHISIVQYEEDNKLTDIDYKVIQEKELQEDESAEEISMYNKQMNIKTRELSHSVPYNSNRFASMHTIDTYISSLESAHPPPPISSYASQFNKLIQTTLSNISLYDHTHSSVHSTIPSSSTNASVWNILQSIHHLYLSNLMILSTINKHNSIIRYTKDSTSINIIVSKHAPNLLINNQLLDVQYKVEDACASLAAALEDHVQRTVETPHAEQTHRCQVRHEQPLSESLRGPDLQRYREDRAKSRGEEEGDIGRRGESAEGGRYCALRQTDSHRGYAVESQEDGGSIR